MQDTLSQSPGGSLGWASRNIPLPEAGPAERRSECPLRRSAGRSLPPEAGAFSLPARRVGTSAPIEKDKKTQGYTCCFKDIIQTLYFSLESEWCGQRKTQGVNTQKCIPGFTINEQITFRCGLAHPLCWTETIIKILTNWSLIWNGISLYTFSPLATSVF